jgi:hypothetical protein
MEGASAVRNKLDTSTDCKRQQKVQKFAAELKSIWDEIDMDQYTTATVEASKDGHKEAAGAKLETPMLSPVRFGAECGSYNSYGVDDTRQTGPSQGRKGQPSHTYPFTPMLSNHNVEGYS